jgi:hypothetical protein
MSATNRATVEYRCERCTGRFARKSTLEIHLSNTKDCWDITKDPVPPLKSRLELLRALNKGRAKKYEEGGLFECTTCDVYRTNKRHDLTKHQEECKPADPVPADPVPADTADTADPVPADTADKLRELRELREELLKERREREEQVRALEEQVRGLQEELRKERSEREERNERKEREQDHNGTRKEAGSAGIEAGGACVKLNPSGSEDWTHVVDDFIVESILNKNIGGLVDKLHFDPICPANRNVRKLDDDTYQLWRDHDDGTGWRTMDQINVCVDEHKRGDVADELILNVWRYVNDLIFKDRTFDEKVLEKFNARVLEKLSQEKVDSEKSDSDADSLFDFEVEDGFDENSFHIWWDDVGFAGDGTTKQRNELKEPILAMISSATSATSTVS